MIAHIKGKVAHSAAEYVIVDVMGIGYRIYTPHAGGQIPKVGAEMQYFTYLHVREDALQLYGFRTREEYELFLLLISVSGIGPKVALGVLRSITPLSFCQAVRQNALAALTALPGIGKKTAERVVMELKDKIGVLDSDEEFETTTIGTSDIVAHGDDAMQALVALGYTLQEAARAVREAKLKLSADAPIESVIKQALKEASRQGAR